MLSAFNLAKNLLDKKEKPFATAVFFKWKEIVGERYASMASPFKITSFAQQKVLILQARYGCGLIVQHESQNILQLINNYLKQPYFSRVKVIQVAH